MVNRSNVAYLVTESFEQDDYGVWQRTETDKKVYVDVTSVTSQEWFEGGRNGLNPELRFRMFTYDYSGEKIIKFNNIQYTIYRTYLRKNDEIELYCEKKKGNEKAEEPEESPAENG